MLPLGLLELGESRGVSRVELAASAQLPPDVVHTLTVASPAPDARVPLATAHALWRALLTRFPSAHLGLELATLWRPETLGLLGYLAANATTLGEALDRFVAFQSLVDGEARLSYRVESGRLIARIADDPELEALRQPIEALLASGHAFFALPARAPLACRRVRLRHRSSLARAPYRAFFGVDVEHGAERNELEYDASLLAMPIPGSDPQLGAYLLRAAESARRELDHALAEARADLVERATSVVRARLSARAAGHVVGDVASTTLALDDLSTASLARALGLGARSLQRSLAARGVHLRDLVDAERHRLAELLLAAPSARVADIAHALG